MAGTKLPDAVGVEETNQLKGHVWLSGSEGDRPGETSGPGDGLVSFWCRRGDDTEAQSRRKVGNIRQRPVAVDLHRHLSREEGIELLRLEATLEGFDLLDAAKSVVDFDHVLQGFDNRRFRESAGASVGAHEATPIEPAIDV